MSDRGLPRGAERFGRIGPVAVIGAGTLGSQIALFFSTRGEPVSIFDLDRSAAEAARARIAGQQDAALAFVENGSKGAVLAAPSLAEAVAGASLVVESVPERPALKREVFAELDRLAGPDAILASNSSSIPTSRFVDGVKDRTRALNLHFYRARRAVEVMSCGATDPAAIALLMRDLPLYGLQPFEVRKESVGFIYNRIWAAVKREALQVVAEGVATVEEVDRFYGAVHGGEEGPFRRMDRVGLDVVLDIENNYASEYPGLDDAPRRLLRDYVDQGFLGAKSGRGFYDGY